MIVQPVEVDVTFKNAFTVEPEMMDNVYSVGRGRFEARSWVIQLMNIILMKQCIIQTWQLPEELTEKK